MSKTRPLRVVINHDQLALTDRLYSIGRLMKMFALTARAIRFYCDCGLIKAVDGYHDRTFDCRNVRRLALVLIGKDLGFPLRDIAEMLRDGGADEQPFLEIDPVRIDQEIAFLSKQREKTEEQLKSLLAWQKSPSRDLELLPVAAA